MSKTLIQDVVTLTREGWRPYPGQPDNAVYLGVGCPHWQKSAKRPYWFVRDKFYLCVGCASRCCLENPAGFQPMLPIQEVEAPKRYYNISPAEMLARHDLLTVRQAAYCLNVSERAVYDYISEGKLVSLKEKPLRVLASEVKKMRETYDV